MLTQHFNFYSVSIHTRGQSFTIYHNAQCGRQAITIGHHMQLHRRPKSNTLLHLRQGHDHNGDQ